MHIDDDDINAAAVRMLADYDAGEPGTIYRGVSRSLMHGGKLQTRLRMSREQVIGYKIDALIPIGAHGPPASGLGKALGNRTTF